METFKPTVKAIINSTLKKWNINLSINDIYEKYNEPHRFYHNIDNHLSPMLESIIKYNDDMKPQVFEILIITAIFHDIIYNPKSKSNEEDSVKFFISTISENNEITNSVIDTILMTKTHKHNNEIEELFCRFDLEILTKELPELLKWEEQIYKEYEFVNWKEYKSSRINVIRNFIETVNLSTVNFPINHKGLEHLIYIIENKEPNVAIYAGSFNPFHLGHMNIVRKAEKLFDKVIIAKGRNDSKDVNEIIFETEFKKLQNLFPTKELITYKGLLAELLKEQLGKITLVRGLRNGYDLDAENTLMTFVKDMYTELQIVYIPCDKEYEHISSSTIRSLEKYGDSYIEKYLP